jgi:hypothetical protein
MNRREAVAFDIVSARRQTRRFDHTRQYSIEMIAFRF